MQVRWLKAERSGGVTAEQVSEVVGSRTALLLLSDVAYRSGYLADVPAITALAHDHGALVLWDVCHSAGVIPQQLDDWRVDLVVGYRSTSTSMAAPAHRPSVMCVPISMSVSSSPSKAGWVRRVRLRWRSATPRPMASVVFSVELRRSSGCLPSKTCWRSLNEQKCGDSSQVHCADRRRDSDLRPDIRPARCPYRLASGRGAAGKSHHAGAS